MPKIYQVDSLAESAAQKVNVNGRGGKREACGYLCASVGRGPNAINPSFYVVAILALAYLDARCFDSKNPNFDGAKCTQYEYIEFTYARSSLESIDWQKKYKMSNITEGEQGLLSYGCGGSADPCMQPLNDVDIKYPGFDTKLVNLPNDWYPKFHDSLVEGVDFIQNISAKIPRELIPKEHTCDCRGGQARLGTSNGVAPSTVITYSSPILSAVELIFFPYIAALTDYSEHRKLVWLVGFALTQVTVFAVGIMWHDYVWVVALTSMVCTGIAFDLMLFPIQAYLPEFGDTRAVIKLTGYSQAVNSAGQFAFVIIGIAISVVVPLVLGPLYGTIVAAMIVTGLVAIFGVVWTVPAAFMIQKRSATPLPQEWEGKSLMLVGFLRIGRTTCEAVKRYRQVVKFWAWQALMIAWAYSTVFLSTTYFSQQLRMDQLENVLFVLCVLACIVPGALLIVAINKCVSHKWILVVVTVLAVVMIAIPCFGIWQPQQKIYTYPFAILSGLIFGAYYGLQSGVYATIIPGGQEALYTAVGMWFGNLLRWIPPILYGVIVNLSATQSHRWAFFHLIVYPALALVVIIFIDFKLAERDIKTSLSRRKTDHVTSSAADSEEEEPTKSMSKYAVAPMTVEIDPEPEPAKTTATETETATKPENGKR